MNIYRNWFLAGHVSELPRVGDFKVVNVARESAIIVRDQDGDLRAFANVCRHRGSLVCLEARGNADRFSCPYHGWMYGLDGSLVAARDMPDDFDKSSHGLRAVSLDVVLDEDKSEAMRKAGHKLPVKTRFVKREEL